MFRILLLLFNINYVYSWNFAMYQTQINSVNSAITKEISFFYYNGPTVKDYVKIPLANGEQILNQPTYDPSRKTVFFFHGWSEKPSYPNDYSSDIMADAFMKANTANFIVVNYENLVQHEYNITSWTPEIMNMGVGYFQAVQNTTQIGTALGYFFKMFVSNCECQDRLHLIGFSLGAQIMSFIATVYGNGKLRRLTGLEAAGPLYSLPGYDHLDIDHGIFLDTIHTDAGVFGYGSSYGTVDFWPNFGRSLQPYCKTDTVYKCSHYMSVRYYAESVINVYAFKAVQCQSAVMWSTYLCNGNNVTHMGYGVSTLTPKGDYYLRTNDASPFAISGDDGLTVGM